MSLGLAPLYRQCLWCRRVQCNVVATCGLTQLPDPLVTVSDREPALPHKCFAEWEARTAAIGPG